MRPRPEKIRLGAREWPVRPLTLRQVQEIEPIIMSSAAEPKGNVAAALAIVANALGRDHAAAAALLGDIEATAHARNRRRHGERYNLSLFRTMPGAVTGIFRSIFPAAIIQHGLAASRVRHHYSRARRRYNLDRTVGLLSRPLAQST